MACCRGVLPIMRMISLETCDFSVRDLVMLMEPEEAIF